MLVFYAPNVHVGGGLALLRALLEAAPAIPDLRLILDGRARSALPAVSAAQVHWTAHSLAGRLHAERLLAQWAGPGATVLCFHNLPPLWATAARVVVFLQNRHLVTPESLDHFPLRTRLRLQAERWIARARRRSVGAYVVQTASMARALQQWYGEAGGPPVHVCPFYQPLEAAPAGGGASWDFLYVSDGEAHKNHERLLQAWVRLAQRGLRPSLALTLGPRHASLAARITAQAREHGLQIHLTGQVSRAEVAALYARSKAVIFPSTAESFGLPLIEARDAGLPILASELDFVRDVCEPVQTFDPASPVSIERAVLRHLGAPEAPQPTRSPAQFWDLLLSNWAKP